MEKLRIVLFLLQNFCRPFNLSEFSCVYYTLSIFLFLLVKHHMKILSWIYHYLRRSYWHLCCWRTREISAILFGSKNSFWPRRSLCHCNSHWVRDLRPNEIDGPHYKVFRLQQYSRHSSRARTTMTIAMKSLKCLDLRWNVATIDNCCHCPIWNRCNVHSVSTIVSSNRFDSADCPGSWHCHCYCCR